MHVLDRTETQPLEIVSVDGAKVDAIVCWRSEPRLAPNDYLVPLKLGIRLYIKTDTGNSEKDRTVSVEMADGSFRARLVSGPAWDSAEQDEVIEAITRFNKRAHSAP
jgi:hypothetical protein